MLIAQTSFQVRILHITLENKQPCEKTQTEAFIKKRVMERISRFCFIFCSANNTSCISNYFFP